MIDSFSYGEVTAFATPRRLAVQIAACENLQPEQLIQKKGPKLSAAFDNDGQPTKALRRILEVLRDYRPRFTRTRRNREGALGSFTVLRRPALP